MHLHPVGSLCVSVRYFVRPNAQITHRGIAVRYGGQSYGQRSFGRIENWALWHMGELKIGSLGIWESGRPYAMIY